MVQLEKSEGTKTGEGTGSDTEALNKRLQEVLEEKQEVMLNYQSVQQEVNSLTEKLKVKTEFFAGWFWQKLTGNSFFEHKVNVEIGVEKKTEEKLVF